MLSVAFPDLVSMLQRWCCLSGLFAFSLSVSPSSVLTQQPINRAAPRAAPIATNEAATAPTSQLGKRIDLSIDSLELRVALRTIANKANLDLTYASDEIPKDSRVTLKARGIAAEQAFRQVLKLAGVDADVSITTGNRVNIKMRQSHDQQVELGSIGGRIIDSAKREGITGVTVSVVGHNLSTVTDRQGNYTIQHVPTGTQTVTAKFLGYRTVSKSVQVEAKKRAELQIVMASTATMLSGVVTTATGQQRRLEIGTAVTSINVDSVMRVAPITSVTDLLETRVPGLEVLRSSGIPGDPSRIRLRGISSINRDSDPIVIVDGFRINASERRSISKTPTVVAGKISGSSISPSALDQIDPNSIETIDVFNGPSATAMYGADAANGVIVITTKRGRSGPPQWDVRVDQGLSQMAGDYPLNVFPLGHSLVGSLFGGQIERCSLVAFGCVVDSVKFFQALNDPRYTTFGTGYSTRVSSTVSGGSGTRQYSFTASGSSETGIFELPTYAREQYVLARGIDPPHWMVRPDRYTTWSGLGTLQQQLTPSIDLDVKSQLSHSRQQKLNNGAAVQNALQNAYIEKGVEPIVPGNLNANQWLGFPTSYGRREIHQKLNISNGAALQIRVHDWLPVRASAGLDLLTADDETLSPAGMSPNPVDSVGGFSVSRETSHTGTAQVFTTLPIPLGGQRKLNVTGGLDGRFSGTVGMSGGDSILERGVSELAVFRNGSNWKTSTASYGWSLEPKLDLASRFFVIPGFRIDGGSGSGIRSNFSGFPKINFSWLVSNEPYFPTGLGISELRLRTSFGSAGVLPDLTQKARIFQRSSTRMGGETIDMVGLRQIGNSALRPERSGEIEGGFEAALFQNRVKLSFTTYRKTTKDAIINMNLPYSVGVGRATIPVNIGVLRNMGTEAVLDVNPIQRASMGWNVQMTYSKNDNKVVSLAPGVDEVISVLSRANVRYVPGYPAAGIWDRPILGYADLNHDNRIDQTEIRIGDTAVFIGSQLANYRLTGATGVTLLSGRLSVHSTLQYVDGLTQVNDAVDPSLLLAPELPQGTQAGMMALVHGDAYGVTAYGIAQQTNTLRWQSISLNVVLPASMARTFRGRALELALQGNNIALWTNYRGKDPNVSSGVQGNNILDSGQIPTPRTWSVMIRWRH